MSRRFVAPASRKNSWCTWRLMGGQARKISVCALRGTRRRVRRESQGEHATGRSWRFVPRTRPRDQALDCRGSAWAFTRMQWAACTGPGLGHKQVSMFGCYASVRPRRTDELARRAPQGPRRDVLRGRAHAHRAHGSSCPGAAQIEGCGAVATRPGSRLSPSTPVRR